MQYAEYLETMSGEDFLKAYEAKKREFEIWQQEHDARMAAIRYEESKMCKLLRMLDDIFRAEYVGKSAVSEELARDCFTTFFSNRIEVNAILTKLNQLAYETDKICIDNGRLETALEEALPFR